MNSEAIFITDNVKLAAALTAVGFRLKTTDCVRDCDRKTIDGRPRHTVICEFDTSHLGVAADYLQAAFEGLKYDLAAEVDEIIRKRQITDQEYILLAFDAARSALNNRSTIIYCVGRNLPLVSKSIGNGRTLVYRDGTPKEELQRLLDNA